MPRNRNIVAKRIPAGILVTMDILGRITNAQSAAPLANRTIVARLLQGDVTGLELGKRAAGIVVEASSERTVVDINGRFITLPGKLGYEAGEQAGVRLLARGPKTLVQLFQLNATGNEQKLPLALGQQLTARIVNPMPGGRTLIAVDGRLMSADGPEGLRNGTVIPLQVEQLRPELVFRIIGHEDSVGRLAAEMVSERLPNRRSLGETLQSLRAALRGLLATPADDPLPAGVERLNAWLQNLFPDGKALDARGYLNLLRHGGLTYEAVIARLMAENPGALAAFAEQDLKGLLLRAMRDVDASTQLRLKSLAEPLLNHLNQIEILQLLNVLSQMHGVPFHIELPSFSDDSSSAELLIEPDEQGADSSDEGPKTFKVMLKLELETLGPIRVDAAVHEESIQVAIYAEEAPAVDRLNAVLAELESSLKQLGFHDIWLAAKPAEQLPRERREKFQSMGSGIPQSLDLVDVQG